MKYVFTIAIFLLFAEVLSAQSVEVLKYFDAEKTQLKERYFVKDNDPTVLYGNYESYYLSGQLKSKGQHINNETFGIWEYFYENGKLKMKGRLIKGNNHGMWEYYFENGNLSMKGNIFRNMRQDDWKYYFENGVIKSEGKYKDDVKVGLWTYYYEDGKRNAQAFYRGRKGAYKEFYPSGNLKSDGFIIDGKSDSLWQVYYESGVLKSRGYYKEGQKQGHWKYYYPNTKLHSEGAYNKGITEGKWTYYHEEGSLSSEGAERDGKKEGYWKLYYEDGNVKGEGVFKSGTGDFSEFYESGKIKAKGVVKDGKNHGLWIYYYENGEVEGECDFVEGEGDYVGYYNNGAVKLKGKISDGAKIGTWELFDESGKLVGYYRPVYEEEPSFFGQVAGKEMKLLVTPDYEKPEFRFKPKSPTYFTSRLNEYKGIIIEANPLYALVNNMPVGIEYYFQERMGVQLQLNYVRKPFMSTLNSLTDGELFSTGLGVTARHKFYHKDTRSGMPYFGYDLRYVWLNHAEERSDVRAFRNQNRLEVGIFGGTRWMLNVAEKGFTFDIYGGVGGGYRTYSTLSSGESLLPFTSLEALNSGWVISPRIGFMLGYNFSLTKKSARIQ